MRYLSIIVGLIAIFILSACVPGTTDEADFYDLCASHNRRFSNNDTLILQHDEARSRSDYHFWRGDQRASITVIVWMWGDDAKGEPANSSYVQRRCEFRETRKGWRLV
jgi:hypothetical protein